MSFFLTLDHDGEASVLECGVVLNFIFTVTYQYLKPFNIVQIKLLEFGSNTWNHLTVCKQMINIKYNYWCYIAILETI